jgi:two-component system sensor histidine kinase CreC
VRFTRVTLFFIAFIITLGFYQLTRHFLSEVEPQTFQATEEVLVDIAHLLAEQVESEVGGEGAREDKLRQAFSDAHQRKFEARIFEHMKSGVGINAYLTNKEGIVIFDSDEGRREGENYSGKRDVALTLAGKYGARSSRSDELNAGSSILYVGAPVGDPEDPIGVLTVFKPQADVLPIIRERKRVIYSACAMIGGGILFLIAVVFLWLFRPIGQITEYAKAIERGERPPKPKVGIGREVNTLAHALDAMRDMLEGRRYAERYIQTLTHEMKSPLAAIRGAAELLDEEMPLEARRRFLRNILEESNRSERLINRLLELSAIESRTSLESSEELDFRSLVSFAVAIVRPLSEGARVSVDFPADGPAILLRGDSFILRAAILNLLENAIDFSPAGGTVVVTITKEEEKVILSIRDSGPGIPDYAKEKIFERFYSLRHHAMGRKGTGLGLTLVREAAELHHGSISLEPAEGRGTIAKLSLAGA